MYKIQYLIFKFFQKLLLLFPEKVRFKFAEMLAIISYYLIKKRRIIALANIKLAFPEKSETEIVRIAKESYKIMFKGFISTLWIDEYLEKNVEIKNIEKLENLIEQKQGVVVALIHMGNMESNIKPAEKYEIITVAKAQRNPYIDKYITDSRKKLNVRIIKKSRTTSKELLKEIDSKKIIALFSDHRDKGTEVEFFGEKTTSPTGAVNIALKHKMPLVICYNVMNPDNTSTICFTDEIELERTEFFKNDVKVNTQKLISNMEQIITNYPNQWMWFHDRWRIYSKMRKEKNK